MYAPLKAQHFMAIFPKSLIGLLRAKRILKDIIYVLCNLKKLYVIWII